MNRCFTRTRVLSLTLSALVALPTAAFAAPNRPVAKAVPAPQAGLLYVVNSTGDGDNVGSGDSCDDGTGKCTLRAAIQASNAHPGADEDQVRPPRVRPLIHLRNQPRQGAAGHRRQPLNRRAGGRGASLDGLTLPRLQRDHGGSGDVLDLSIIGGFPSGRRFGGGIQNANAGTVNVDRCTLYNNSANLGGGIANAGTGTVNVNESTLSVNRARGAPNACCSDALGGGIYNNAGTVNVTGSSFDNNQTHGSAYAGVGGKSRGGAIYNQAGVVHVVNSTFVSNAAFRANASTQPGRTEGGALATVGGTTHISNSTIFNNRAGYGGGVFVGDTDPLCEVKSTLLAANLAGSGPDTWGTLTSQGYNFFSDASGATITPAQATDIFGGDPMIDLNRFNGGPTYTLGLRPGSPAIDKGTSAGLAGPLSTDQRGAGFPRKVNNPFVANAPGGDGTDIGAFEVQPTFLFSNPAYSVREGSPSATITIKLTGILDDEVQVNYAAFAGTAASSKDFTPQSGTLTFAPREVRKTFTVPIIDDALDEVNETVHLGLSRPTPGVYLGVPSSAVLQIVDDDPLPSLSINNVAVIEGDSHAVTATLTVRLSAPSGKTVTVKYATADGMAQAPGDYAASTGSLTFLPGQTSKTIGVVVKGDALVEQNETIFVNLGGAGNATVGDNQGQVTIRNDD